MENLPIGSCWPKRTFKDVDFSRIGRQSWDLLHRPSHGSVHLLSSPHLLHPNQQAERRIRPLRWTHVAYAVPKSLICDPWNKSSLQIWSHRAQQAVCVKTSLLYCCMGTSRRCLRLRHTTWCFLCIEKCLSRTFLIAHCIEHNLSDSGLVRHRQRSRAKDNVEGRQWVRPIPYILTLVMLLLWALLLYLHTVSNAWNDAGAYSSYIPGLSSSMRETV